MSTSITCLVIALTAVCLQAGGSTQPRDPDAVPEGLAQSDWQSIRAAYEAGRHAFAPVAGGWQARNPGQRWTTKFDGRGFLAEPRDGGWQWGLELKSYGFPGAERTVGGVPEVKAAGQRLTYDWDASVQEWFVNDTRGLEHGFTVRERPGRDGKDPTVQSLSSFESLLSFTLTVRGTLRPRISADAQGVAFQNASGATVLNYSGLKVWAADGKVLASRFEAAGDNGVRLLVEEHGARYPVTIDPIAQQAYLKAHQVNEGDSFGFSVAVSGDTVVVGAPNEDGSTTGINSTPNERAAQAGAAYVFVRSGTNWTQQAYLKAHQVNMNDQFGWSVAVSGDTVVVGAPFEASSTTGINSAPNESAERAGAACLFVRGGATWTQQAYLKAHQVTESDYFGSSVAVSGDTVVVGAPYEASNTTGVNSTPDEGAPGAGAAYVFTGFGSSPDADGDGLLDSWELTHWPTIIGHSAQDDFDRDGYVELLELALGLNPKIPNPGGLPPVTREDGCLTMTLTKQPGVTYEVQSAGTVLEGQPDSFSPASTTVLINDATTLKVRDNILIGTAPDRFLRVKVTAAP